jgi:hypothetical protein
VRVETFSGPPPNATMPSWAVSVAKTIQIDIYDPVTGALRKTHSPPLEVAVQLAAGEIPGSCPAGIALFHIKSDGSGAPTSIRSINCTTGVIIADISETSSYSIVRTAAGALPFRQFLPSVPRGG